MKKKAISLIVVTVWMFTLLGCSTTRVITPKTGFTLSKDAVLVTTNGARLGIRFVKTTGDSIVARDYTFDRNLHFHFSEVQKVVVKDHSKGAWQGFWRGVAAGAILGYLAGEDNAQDALASRGASAIILGNFGGAAGAIIGATKGKTETYLFEETQEEANTSEGLLETDAKFVRKNRR